MIVLIPLGGIGRRFKESNASVPKALIEVCGKSILFWVLDNLKMKDIDFVYIPYNNEYKYHNLEEKIMTRYPQLNFKFLQLLDNTRGAAETISIALQKLQNEDDQPVLCIDGDNFYTCDIIKTWGGRNCIFTVNDYQKEPVFSYIKHNTEGKVQEIVEKVKISDRACTGAYGFSSVFALRKYCKFVLDNNITQKGEFYVSVVISEMLKNNIMFESNNIAQKDYFSLGTPDKVLEYEHPFLFDLDGTLVNTDHIYVEVWHEILKKYDVVVDSLFFDNFIKGNSDSSFLKYLIPDISQEEIKNISKTKDLIFIEKLKDSNQPILVPGAIDFIKTHSNRPIAIVTSCNRIAAEFIIKSTGLDEYVQLLISANDCVHHKPHPEPYKKAISELNLNSKKCIIFEDSLSGYKSAMNSEVYKIVVICEKKLCDDDIRANADYMVGNYVNFDWDDFMRKNKDSKSVITDYSDKLLNVLSYLPVKKVYCINENLKTGYICDIDQYTLVYNNGQKEEIILKISNFDNSLSEVASKLNMYKNESYFYTKLSTLIEEIKIPKCFGIIEEDKKDGIILGNLTKNGGTFGMDLNKNINMLLKVIYKMFLVHNKFYFTSKEEVIPDMKPLLSMNKIHYYKELVDERFEYFLQRNKVFLTKQNVSTFEFIFKNFQKFLDESSEFPLSFCHGDLKSPNIFYSESEELYFLDWQYIHLNKGCSDIAFLLVESIKFDIYKCDLAVNYYYQLINELRKGYTYEQYMVDFKRALCVFPFFVCVWFNSESSEKLIDKSFPILFMKNLLKYYEYYIKI